MEQRATILERFAAALNQGLLDKFGKIPSTSQFAAMFNALTVPDYHITRETARKWIKGLTYPEIMRLQVLMQWLTLDPDSILIATTETSASVNRSADQPPARVRKQIGRLPVRFAQQALDALTAHIAVIDGDGVICQVNQSWSAFAKENGGSPKLQFGVGVNYLKACDRVQQKSATTANVMAAGIRAVLAGSLQEFTLKYPCHSLTERRWFVARTTSFDHEGRRYAVVSHEAVSEEVWHKLDYPQLPVH